MIVREVGLEIEKQTFTTLTTALPVIVEDLRILQAIRRTFTATS